MELTGFPGRLFSAEIIVTAPVRKARKTVRLGIELFHIVAVMAQEHVLFYVFRQRF